jgi:hypothetical protein
MSLTVNKNQPIGIIAKIKNPLTKKTITKTIRGKEFAERRSWAFGLWQGMLKKKYKEMNFKGVDMVFKYVYGRSK